MRVWNFPNYGNIDKTWSTYIFWLQQVQSTEMPHPLYPLRIRSPFPSDLLYSLIISLKFHAFNTCHGENGKITCFCEASTVHTSCVSHFSHFSDARIFSHEQCSLSILLLSYLNPSHRIAPPKCVENEESSQIVSLLKLINQKRNYFFSHWTLLVEPQFAISLMIANFCGWKN